MTDLQEALKKLSQLRDQEKAVYALLKEIDKESSEAVQVLREQGFEDCFRLIRDNPMPQYAGSVLADWARQERKKAIAESDYIPWEDLGRQYQLEIIDQGEQYPEKSAWIYDLKTEKWEKYG